MLHKIPPLPINIFLIRMKKVQSLNWENFKSRNSHNPQKEFEHLCYLIFCKIHKIPFGLNKYINQAAIETEPYIFGEKKIAFQAKFYTGKLTSKKAELQKSILNAAAQGINKIFIFTNLSWGQNNYAQAPEAKQKLDKLATQKGLELEWFTESRFDALSADPVVQAFFDNQVAVKDEVQSWIRHSQALCQSKSKVPMVQGVPLIYDRQQDIQNILESKADCTIISGESGVGKSYLLHLLALTNKNVVLLIKDAQELSHKHHLEALFQHCAAEDFFAFLNEADGDKYFIIDTAEHLLNDQNDALLYELLNTLHRYSWKLILCCRSYAANTIKSHLPHCEKLKEIAILPIHHETLSRWSEENGFPLPEDRKLIELIQLPIHLKEYLSLPRQEQSRDIRSFYVSIWNNITNNQQELDEALRELAIRHANSGAYYLDTRGYAQMSDKLLEKNIISREDQYFYFTHDLYEELAIFMHIDNMWHTEKVSNIMVFFESLGSSAIILRTLRKWLTQKIESDTALYHLVAKYVTEKELSNPTVRSLLTSIIQSSHFEEFIQNHTDELWTGEHELLHTIIQLVRLYSIRVDSQFSDKSNVHSVYSTIPHGDEWVSILKTILVYNGDLNRQDFDVFTGLLNNLIPGFGNRCFNSYDHLSFRTISGQCALKLYRKAHETDGYYMQGATKRILTFLVSVNIDVLLPDLESIIKDIPRDKPYRSFFYNFLLDSALQHPYAEFWASKAPHLLYQIMPLIWKAKSNQSTHCHTYIDTDETYGISHEVRLMYLDTSALNTPIYYLLRHDFIRAIEFTIEFINESIETFYQHPNAFYKPDKLKWMTKSGEETYLYSSQSLWNIYRGTSSPCVPYLLTSMHMALERSLYELVENFSRNKNSQIIIDPLNQILHTILDKTRSISLVSVVAAVVREFPSIFLNVALRIFSLKEVFMLDRLRMLRERTCSDPLCSGFTPFSNVPTEHVNDRQAALRRKNRMFSLEQLAIHYQFNITCDTPIDQIQNKITKIIDDHYVSVMGKPDDKPLYTLLKHIDARNLHICKDAETGHMFIIPREFKSMEDWKKQASDFQNNVYPHNSSFVEMQIRMELLSDKSDSLPAIPLEQLEDRFKAQRFSDKACEKSKPEFGSNWDEYNCCILLYILMRHDCKNGWWREEKYYSYLLNTLIANDNDIMEFSYLESFLNQLKRILVIFPQSCNDLPYILAEKLHTCYVHYNEGSIWSKALSRAQAVDKQFPVKLFSNYLKLCTQTKCNEYALDTEKLQFLTEEELHTIIKAIPIGSTVEEINKLMIGTVNQLISHSFKISYDIHSSLGYYILECPNSYADDAIRILAKHGQANWLGTILRFYFYPEAGETKFQVIWQASVSSLLQLKTKGNKLPYDFSNEVLGCLFMEYVELSDSNESLVCKIVNDNNKDICTLIQRSCHANHCIPAITRLLSEYPSLIQRGIEWIYLAFDVHSSSIHVLENTTALKQLETIVIYYEKTHFNSLKKKNLERARFFALLGQMVQLGSTQARIMLEKGI